MVVWYLGQYWNNLQARRTISVSKTILDELENEGSKNLYNMEMVKLGSKALKDET